MLAGGIRENAPLVRARICQGLRFLGVDLSEARNANNAAVISADNSRVIVRVIRADEAVIIAKAVAAVLGSNPTVTGR